MKSDRWNLVLAVLASVFWAEAAAALPPGQSAGPASPGLDSPRRDGDMGQWAERHMQAARPERAPGRSGSEFPTDRPTTDRPMGRIPILPEASAISDRGLPFRDVAVVPLPNAALMLLGGLAALIGLKARRRLD